MNFKETLFIYGDSLSKSFNIILSNIAKKYKITTIESITMMFIDRKENITINQLSNLLKFNQGNTSSLCKKLEKKELIIRERNTSDERIVNLKITTQGKKIINKFDKELSSLENNVIKKFGPERLNNIINSLKDMEEIVKYVVEEEK